MTSGPIFNAILFPIIAWKLRNRSDEELEHYDIVGPWPWLQKLNLWPGHAGSESWADHLGLAPYHDNSIKRNRRRVFNALVFGQAIRWYRARGLGSPPD